MKKNTQNGEKINIFERIRAFFLRRKNGDKAVLNEIPLDYDSNNLSDSSESSVDVGISFESTKDNIESYSESLQENKGLTIDSEVVDSKESDSQASFVDENASGLTPQQEYVACKNINVTASETVVRSFIAKLIAVDDELKEYYSDLKNYALSFSGTRYRTSWQYDSIYKTKTLISRFVIKGKSLWMYVRLSPEEIPDGTNFVTTKDKKYEGLETGLKIQGTRTFKQAKNLLLLACEKEGLSFAEREKEIFIPESMTDDELFEKGLIRKIITSTNPK